MKSRRKKAIIGVSACMAALLTLQVCLTAFGGESEEKKEEEPAAFTILPDQVPAQKYRGGQYEVDVYGSFTQLKDETGTASIVEDSRLLMKRGNMIAVPTGMSYLNGRVDQVVVDSISGSDGETRYLSVLEDDYRIEDYYEELKWPDKLSNSGIKEISRTLDTSDTVLMVRYTDNTVAAFNYVTGNLIFKDESEKQSLSFGEYVGNWFSEKWNNLFGPSTLKYDEIKFLEKQLEGKPIIAELTGVVAGNGQNLSSTDQVVYNLKGQKFEESAAAVLGEGRSDPSSDVSALEKHMAASGVMASGDITEGIYAPEGKSGVPGSGIYGESGVPRAKQDDMAAQTAESMVYPVDGYKGQEPAGEAVGEIGSQGIAGAEGVNTLGAAAALGQMEGGIPTQQPTGSDEGRAEGEALEMASNTDTAAALGDSSLPLLMEDVVGTQAPNSGDDNQEADGWEDMKLDDAADHGMDDSQKVEDAADDGTDGGPKAEDAADDDTDGSQKAEDAADDGTDGNQKPDDSVDAEAEGKQALEDASNEDTGLQEISLGQFLPVFNPETGKYELYDTQQYLSQGGVKGNILNISENFGQINGGRGSGGLLREVSGWIGYGAALMGIIVIALLFLRRAIDKKLQI